MNRFDNIKDLSDDFYGQIIALIDHSSTLKKQSDLPYDCLVNFQLKAHIQ
jgi:hypothetical protein